MDGPPAVLQWDRGALEASCDRAAAVRAGVEAYLGRAVFADEGSLVVRVSLRRVEENGRTRVFATVTQATDDGRTWGAREVEGDSSCESLDEPLTLVVALMVDAPASQAAPEPPPGAVEQPPPARPALRPPAPSEAVSAGSGAIETVPSLEQATRAPGHLAVLGFGLLSMGAMPAPSVGAEVVVALKPRGFWGLGVAASGLLPQRTAIGSGSLETSLLMLSGSVCPLQGVGDALWWSACGSLGAARLHARSRQVLEARRRSDWFALPGVAVRGGRLVSRQLLVSAGLEALFPVSPTRYVYRSAEGEKQLAFAPSSLMLTAQLGVGWLFK